MEQLTFRAMGCEMLAILDTAGPETARRLAAVPRWFERWEQSLSRFRPNSELSRLNANAGCRMEVSTVLGAVLELALRTARRTGGLITPTLLTALEAAGYDRTFAALPEETGLLRPPPPPAPATWRAIEYHPRTRTVQVPTGVRLDFGGIAKGWAAEQAARRLGRHGPALVDAGGDIAVSGPRTGGAAWPVGVANPTAPDQDLLLLGIKRGTVATSGRDYRRWRQGGAWQHHILDPRTGRPANTDVLSATVIAPTAVEAEAGAKAALILGSRQGLAWLDARPTLAGLVVLDDGQMLPSRRLAQFIWS